MTHPFRLSLALVAALPAAALASSWKIVVLHPEGSDFSSLSAVHSGFQTGIAASNGNPHAALWSGSASSFVDLNPAGAGASEATFTFGSQQVGFADSGQGPRAGFWTGTAASWVDLNPANSLFSWAYATDGEYQGGVSAIDQVGIRASLWQGTAASFIDLSPPGMGDSVVRGIHSGQQVGTVLTGEGNRASLWTGSVDSWTVLHPDGNEWTESSGWATRDGWQVGWVYERSDVRGDRASLWNSTRDSWINLHPRDAENSYAYAVDQGQQAGFTVTSEVSRAAMWSGTADSYVDLHAVLPADYQSSRATGIWHAGTLTYISGSGVNTSTGREEALLWITPCPADFNDDGQSDFFDYLDFAQAFNDEDPSADFNGDSQIDFFDYLDFAQAFDEGC